MAEKTHDPQEGDVLAHLRQEQLRDAMHPRPNPNRWISLPCVEFEKAESSLVSAGGGALRPLFFEADVKVADIMYVAQVPYPAEREHAPSAISFKGGNTIYCTLTRQQLRRRLGIVVEEVAS